MAHNQFYCDQRIAYDYIVGNKSVDIHAKSTYLTSTWLRFETNIEVLNSILWYNVDELSGVLSITVIIV